MHSKNLVGFKVLLLLFLYKPLKGELSLLHRNFEVRHSKIVALRDFAAMFWGMRVSRGRQ